MNDTVAVLSEVASLTAAGLTITLTGDAGQTNLVDPIALPTVSSGITAVWKASSDPTYITVTSGVASQIARLANGASDATVTLTLKLTKGNASKTVDYTVTVEEATS